MGENRRPRGGRSSPNANRCLHTQLSLREPPDPHTCAVWWCRASAAACWGAGTSLQKQCRFMSTGDNRQGRTCRRSKGACRASAGPMQPLQRLWFKGCWLSSASNWCSEMPWQAERGGGLGGVLGSRSQASSLRGGSLHEVKKSLKAFRRAARPAVARKWGPQTVSSLPVQQSRTKQDGKAQQAHFIVRTSFWCTTFRQAPRPCKVAQPTHLLRCWAQTARRRTETARSVPRCSAAAKRRGRAGLIGGKVDEAKHEQVQACAC